MLEGLKFGNLVEDETQYTAELSRTTLDAKPSVFIEWTYVFDLDHLAFTVNEVIHFRLDNMPPADEW